LAYLESWWKMLKSSTNRHRSVSVCVDIFFLFDFFWDPAFDIEMVSGGVGLFVRYPHERLSLFLFGYVSLQLFL
jgi:hypothetical protein